MTARKYDIPEDVRKAYNEYLKYRRCGLEPTQRMRDAHRKYYRIKETQLTDEEREHRRKQQQEYNHRHPEYRRTASHRYYQKHCLDPEFIARRKARYQAHREEILKQQREHRRKQKEYENDEIQS